MKDPLVSIVIVTRNRPVLLQHALQRVFAESYPHKEVVVVDSSSNNDTEKVIAAYPEVRYIHLHEPRKYEENKPEARNKGLAMSSGEILALIDDDSMVQPGWLDALVDTYQDETVGAAGGRIIHIPEPYCELVAGPPQLSVETSGRVTATDLELVSTEQVEVEHLQGCNMSFRRKALEQVGGFDPNYTLSNMREETDLCVRVKKGGWRIIYNPAIAVVHFSARSSQPILFKEKPFWQFSSGRNCTYFTIKNFGLNFHTFASQLILAPARIWGLAAFRSALLTFAALTQTVGRILGLIAAIRWLISSRRRAESAPKIW